MTTSNAARSGGLRGPRWAAGAGATLRSRPGAIGQRVAASADGRAISAVVRRRRIDGDFSSTRIGSQFIMCSGAVWETAGGGAQNPMIARRSSARDSELADAGSDWG
jgi:hypothetical protein